jgi:hypothetical protein
MPRALRLFLPILALVAAVPALAQKPMADSAQAALVASTVREFIRASGETGLNSDNIIRYTTGRFFEKMKVSLGQKPFAPHLDYRIRSVQSIRDGDTLAIVGVTVVTDTLPMFGPVASELTFFVAQDTGTWKISDMRRFARIEDRGEDIRTIDTSRDYPSSLKPRIVREHSAVLLSNDQLRENFMTNRARFDELVARFDRRDSLRILGRIDRNVTQLNRLGIDWGAAAQEIPKEAIDEYLASATAKQKMEIRAELKHVEKLRKTGRDSLAKYARRYHLSVPHIDSTIALMYDLRVAFVNAELPWKRAVQLTVGGIVNDAIGYLYSPSGEIPYVSHEEFYYLEPIADGWWIFRAG